MPARRREPRINLSGNWTMLSNGSEASDLTLFLRSWMANPLGIAAVAPSGASLSKLITSEIDPVCGSVLELGPGTGVFTRALLARGVGEERLTLVEHDAAFARRLRKRFPMARVLCMDAARLSLGRLQSATPFGGVVSGLPLVAMPPRLVIRILASAFDCLQGSGSFYQFTYLPRCPVPEAILDRLGLEAIRIGSTWMNLPPAMVYRFNRRLH